MDVKNASEALGQERAKLITSEARLAEVRQTITVVTAERDAAILRASEGDAKAQKIMDTTAEKLDRLAREERDSVTLVGARRTRVQEAEAAVRVAQEEAEGREVERLRGELEAERGEVVAALDNVAERQRRHATVAAHLANLLRRRGERVQDAELWLAGCCVRLGIFDARAFVWDARLLREDDGERMARLRQQSAEFEAGLAARGARLTSLLPVEPAAVEEVA